jgi:hypothetical protein
MGQSSGVNNLRAAASLNKANCWKGGEHMNWKKLLLIAAVAGAFTFAGAAKSEAGVRVGIGIGFPIGYGYSCGYPYPGYYPYPYGYPYGYAPYYASFGYAPVVFSRPVVVFRNGQRFIRHRPR